MSYQNVEIMAMAMNLDRERAAREHLAARQALHELGNGPSPPSRPVIRTLSTAARRAANWLRGRISRELWLWRIRRGPHDRAADWGLVEIPGEG
jgi:hypothetical protein